RRAGQPHGLVRLLAVLGVAQGVGPERQIEPRARRETGIGTSERIEQLVEALRERGADERGQRVAEVGAACGRAARLGDPARERGTVCRSRRPSRTSATAPSSTSSPPSAAVYHRVSRARRLRGRSDTGYGSGARSTYPAPRTVWRSLGSNPASILRRR